MYLEIFYLLQNQEKNIIYNLKRNSKNFRNYFGFISHHTGQIKETVRRAEDTLIF